MTNFTWEKRENYSWDGDRMWVLVMVVDESGFVYWEEVTGRGTLLKPLSLTVSLTLGKCLRR